MNAITAQRYKAPQIPLIDPETGQKIKLKLRTMSFAREIANLPHDMRDLQDLLIKALSDRNSSIYQMVSVWNKLSMIDSYWTYFEFSSEHEYLAHYGLPDGTTLASWTIMVNLFDKATYILLGDEVLSFMMRAIGQYEQDVDTRKKCYQEIFDRYCRTNENFDKGRFYRVIREFVATRFEKPAAERAGQTHEQWKTQKAKNAKPNRQSLKRTIVEAPQAGQHFGPTIHNDFQWEKEECPSCVSKSQVIESFRHYVASLENIIKEKLGKDALPARPTFVHEVLAKVN